MSAEPSAGIKKANVKMVGFNWICGEARMATNVATTVDTTHPSEARKSGE